MSRKEFDGEHERSDGGFGGDPEENFFRGEIIYEDPEILLGMESGHSRDERPENAEEAGNRCAYERPKKYEKDDDEEPDEYEAEGDFESDEENTEFYHTTDIGRQCGGQGRRPVREKAEKQARQKFGRKKRRGSFLGRLVRRLLVLSAVLLLGLYLVVQAIYGKMSYSPVEELESEGFRQEGVTNILLIGNDSRENGEDGRSDAMILLSISNKTKTIRMTSLLRDMYVEIPGHDGNRLNAAYAYGGPKLLMETIELNLGICVNRYVLVNFEAFANLVDAVGGVDLELTNEEVQLVNGYLVEYNMLTGKPEGTDYLDASLSGMIHLNGPQALAYSRNRYIGTDFGRTQRQREILSGVLKNLPGALIKNPKQLADGMLPNLTTNLTGTECYLLSLQAGKLLRYDIEQGSVPVEGSYQNATIRGMAVLQVDFEKNKEYLRSSIYGD